MVTKLLEDRTSIVWVAPDNKLGLGEFQVFIGQGASAIEIVTASSSQSPSRTFLLDLWKLRRARRATPVLVLIFHPTGASICGASGETPPVHTNIEAEVAERFACELLDLPDRHSALRFLMEVMPSLDSTLPGIVNRGLVASHELHEGVPGRTDWLEAKSKSATVVLNKNEDMLISLGYEVEVLDNLTYLLLGGKRRSALAVMLSENEIPEAGLDRFNSLSPISYALAKADSELLPWVILVSGNRLRLYPASFDTGMGRRGRTETYVECQASLLAEEHLAYLWLLFSAEALMPNGSLEEILESSQRYSGRLADQLRERIYERVVPTLAAGISNVCAVDPNNQKSSLDHFYEMALTVLFRLLFIAYAEDRDLLPYRYNEAYRRRSLKQKAQELAACISRSTPIAVGASHWLEIQSLWQAIYLGNTEWGIPPYNGGLFSD